MSERELQRIVVLSTVLEGRMTVVSAAHTLDLTTRQVQRLLKTFRAEGAAALRHKARGRPSNHRFNGGVSDLAVQLVHQPRLRREAYGELVQIDGSEHRWFEERDAGAERLFLRGGEFQSKGAPQPPSQIGTASRTSHVDHRADQARLVARTDRRSIGL